MFGSCRAARCRGVVVWAVVILSAGCAGDEPAPDAPPRVDGAALFAQACARCHAADGAGGLPMAAGGPAPADLRQPAWQRSRSDAEIVAAIRDGRGAMPPFHDVLTSAQIDALAAHVRALASPAGEP